MFLIIRTMKVLKIGALCLFAVSTAFGQVGINNENPEADLDIKGGIRMRLLANPIPYHRLILADEEGNLGYNDLGSSSYTLKSIYFKPLSQGVSTQLVNASGAANTPVELNLDIEVIVNSRSSVAVSLEYNLPITAVLAGNSNDVPGFMGATVFRRENNMQTEIEEGSRKFTLYNVPQNYGTTKHVTMPISGRATDRVTNSTSDIKRIVYSVKGYVENGRGTMYFGNFVNASENYGEGVLVIHVYEKKL